MTEETQKKSEEKTDEDAEAREDAPKGLKGRLPFKGRKLPKGTAPKKQGNEEGNGGS